MGFGGVALLDREFIDSEGLFDFVFIIFALSRRRFFEGFRDVDYFRCSIFAEL